MFTRDDILENLDFLPEEGSPDTGFFKWNVKMKHKRESKFAGNIDKSTGYRRVRLNGKLYYEHRLVFFLVHGHLPKLVDHIDHNVLNNHPSNLRAATDSQNLVNRRGKSQSSSGYWGVSRTTANRSKPWVAQIKVPLIDGTFGHKNCGYFKNPKHGAIVRDVMVKILYGEYGTLNFPEVDYSGVIELLLGHSSSL